MTASKFRRPAGLLSTGLMILITSMWTFWGIAEFYYEAWGLPFPEPLYYFLPFLITLILTLLALKWPRLGGWIIILLGGAFTIFIMRPRIISSQLTMRAFLSWFPVTFLTLFVGGMFIWGGQAAFLNTQKANDHPWWRRNLRFKLALGLPVLVITGKTRGVNGMAVSTKLPADKRQTKKLRCGHPINRRFTCGQEKNTTMRRPFLLVIMVGWKFNLSPGEIHDMGIVVFENQRCRKRKQTALRLTGRKGDWGM